MSEEIATEVTPLEGEPIDNEEHIESKRETEQEPEKRQKGIMDKFPKIEKKLNPDNPPKEQEIPDEQKLLNTKLKAKVNGKEIEVSVKDLKDSYQLKQASQVKMEEAAKMKKQAQETLDEFTNWQQAMNEDSENIIDFIECSIFD